MLPYSTAALTLTGTKRVHTAGYSSLAVSPIDVIVVFFGDIVRIDTIVCCVSLWCALASGNGALVVVAKETNQMPFTIVVGIAIACGFEKQ